MLGSPVRKQKNQMLPMLDADGGGIPAKQRIKNNITKFLKLDGVAIDKLPHLLREMVATRDVSMTA